MILNKLQKNKKFKKILSSNEDKYIYKDFNFDNDKEEKYERIIIELFYKECFIIIKKFYQTYIGL